jgi:hypothetical protein
MHIAFWLGRPEEERLSGRPRRRCEDNIKMELKEIEWGVMGWILLAQNRD